MTKLISLFGGIATDIDVQIVKENQVIIAYSAGMNQYRLVVYKIKHTKNGYTSVFIYLHTHLFA